MIILLCILKIFFVKSLKHVRTHIDLVIFITYHFDLPMIIKYWYIEKYSKGGGDVLIFSGEYLVNEYLSENNGNYVIVKYLYVNFLFKKTEICY